MRALLPFLTAFASGELHETVRRTKRNAVFYAMIAVLGIILVIFALVAAQVFLASLYGPLEAALIIAGAALVLIILVFVAMKIVAARDRRRALERRASTSLYATAALTLIPYVLRSKVTLAVGLPLAALAGYFLLGGRGDPED